MQWPAGVPEGTQDDAPQLWLGPAGRVELSPDAAARADDRFEAVCAELGILLARHVEPVSARVLPFGSEQLAMVQLLDTSSDSPQLHASTARGTSPAAAVAGAAIDAMTGGHDVLATALPGAVAEGKVRSAVVFTDGDAPVRWGRAEDEARLAALFAVVPSLGSFTATTGPDTYRVLRLPGIGVALVSEGPSASAWVEGWFAALLHATQFAMRASAPSTGVVAAQPPAPAAPERAVPEVLDANAARVLEELELECRRILTAAQDQAREIREAAAADTEALQSRWTSSRVAETLRTDDARASAEAALKEAERERTAMLSDAQRDVDLLRRDMERTCATLLSDTKRECEAMTRDAERARATLLADAKREADELRRDADAARRSAFVPPTVVHHEEWARPEPRYAADTVLSDARRAADELLRDARRAAEDLVRDASRDRDRLFDELRRTHEAALREELHRSAWTRREVVPETVAPSATAPVAGPTTAAAASDESRAAALSLLASAAESVAAMSVLLGRAAPAAGSPPVATDEDGASDDAHGPAVDAATPRATTQPDPAAGLFFGA